MNRKLYILTSSAIALAYFVGARFGLSLAFATKQVTALWPPTGIAVAALVLFGFRVWPAIALGAFAINAIIGDSLLAAAAIAVGNTLGPVLGVASLRRFTSFRLALERVEHVGGFVAMGAMLGVITATNGVLALAVRGAVPWASFGSVWWVWWIGDAMGVIVFAPFLLSLATRAHFTWRAPQLVEAALLFGGLLLVSRFALVGAPEGPTPFQIQYAVFPFIIWVGLRFDARSTAFAVVLLAGVATWGAIHDRGPFSVGNIDRRLILLEMFMAVAAITGLLLNVATCERIRAQRELERVNQGLEKRVDERTGELEQARKTLEAQAGELRRASVTDELTGLLNRRGFMLIADQAIRAAARKREKLVLFFVDLDGMKSINDEFGHTGGPGPRRNGVLALPCFSPIGRRRAPGGRRVRRARGRRNGGERTDVRRKDARRPRHAQRVLLALPAFDERGDLHLRPRLSLDAREPSVRGGRTHVQGETAEFSAQDPSGQADLKRTRGRRPRRGSTVHERGSATSSGARTRRTLRCTSPRP
jgi:integral membrane sensor domain MASE1